jgi:hypothetical protein
MDHIKVKIFLMWLFGRNKSKQSDNLICPACIYCGCSDTYVLSNSNSVTGSPIKIWRGKRYLTCKCRKCLKIFYTEENSDNVIGGYSEENNLIEDEEQLSRAEEELKRQTDEEDDRRY